MSLVFAECLTWKSVPVSKLHLLSNIHKKLVCVRRPGSWSETNACGKLILWSQDPATQWTCKYTGAAQCCSSVSSTAVLGIRQSQRFLLSVLSEILSGKEIVQRHFLGLLWSQLIFNSIFPHSVDNKHKSLFVNVFNFCVRSNPSAQIN